MIRVLSATGLGSVLLAACLTAQTRPDFSGNWIDVRTVNGKEKIEEKLVVTQDAQGLSYISYSANGREGERLAVLFDGSPQSQARQMAGEATSVGTWKGDALLVVTTVTRPGRPQFTYRRLWSIDAAKQLVIETTRTVEGQTPATTKTIYRRQQ